LIRSLCPPWTHLFANKHEKFLSSNNGFFTTMHNMFFLLADTDRAREKEEIISTFSTNVAMAEHCSNCLTSPKTINSDFSRSKRPKR
jgi:hypothetical protein